MTDAPIQWPRALRTGKASPIVCGDLVRAVRTESASAVAHHWGVDRKTVTAWRRALAVPRNNEGTARLMRTWDRHGDDHPRPMHRWTPEELALLGTVPDRAIAERIHREDTMVQRRRARLGIRRPRGRPPKTKEPR